MSSIICITGPTAAGKSASVLALKDYYPIEIINVDSATIYRQMDIGTAKPSQDEQRQCPQHLLDIKDPSESYSVAAFVQDCETLITEIQNRGHIPILVGGTMMYYKALKDGIDDLPEANQAIRKTITDTALEQGWAYVHKQLESLDPITAARLSPNDSQRIQRAIEVCLLTGKPMSSLLGKEKKSTHQYQLISLEPSDRGLLHQRIEKRFDQMLEMGFLDEVQALWQRGDLNADLPSIRCVGYRQIWGYLNQEYSLEYARELGIIATRHLAKRQMTWLRSYKDRHIIDCLSPDVVSSVVQQVHHLLNSDNKEF
ncbi:tRNA (adenosine(37)-N6)-dimethylallyltransferase MiaA [Basilea psittacipulmonis]|uniref:tRNA dimethylallyltransferase n=1 Tax=Basilea psittacipulmonis DSM 24701 TaxID=1072685 RepID=A0A077DDP7_9BURK|nr:tRNA delta(2)-isopentenylpyrophosphate transferase [Basilea psittacipulmonis DSM 24701]